MDRYEIVIKLLLHKQWMTSSELSKASEISIRTVQRYTSDLNKLFPNLIHSGRKGFKLNFEVYKTLDLSFFQDEDRVKKIINVLIFTNDMTLEQLEENLYVSTSTLKNDLEKARNILSTYHLTLNVKTSNVYIVGTEKNKRQLIKDYVYGETKSGFINLKDLQDFFPAYNPIDIVSIISQEFNTYKLYANDYTLYSLTLHILIKIERTQQHFYLSNSNINLISNNIFQEVSLSICSKIGEKHKIVFSDTEIKEFAILISCCTLYHRNISKNSNILLYVTKEIHQLANQLILNVNDFYGVNLTNTSFIDNFALHLNNMIIRLKNQIVIKNPLLLTLKEAYPFIYEISIFISNQIEKETNLVMTEDEIAYIALHLGSQVEELQSLSTKVNCVLLCPEFYSLNQRLITSLNKRYGEEIIIINVLSSKEDLKEYTNSYDLLISTIPLDSNISTTCIQINAILSSKDFIVLDKIISTKLKEKSIINFKYEIQKLYSKSHFMIVDEVMDYEKIIKKMTQLLTLDNYVTADFAQACLDRERMSPTVYSDIAIPHPIELVAKKSIVAVAINRHHFQWLHNKKVKMIMILAIKKEDIPSFKFIFDFISNYANNNLDIRNVTNSNSFFEFELNLNECLDNILLDES